MAAAGDDAAGRGVTGGGGPGVVRALVAEWSRLVARQRFGSRPALVPRPVIEAAGVLVPGATNEQIAATEIRLGCRLPPSYRQFLAESNGAFGGHLGLQLEPVEQWWDGTEPARPRSLLPVSDIGPMAFDDPQSVDDVVPFQVPVQLGQSTLHHPTHGDEVGYLAAPWSGTPVMGKRGHAHWSIRIGWDDEPGSIMMLNPMVMDAAGEWEVVVLQADEEFRFPSFGVWLERSVGQLRRCRPSLTRSVERLELVSTSAPAGLGAAAALIGVAPDPGQIIERLELVLLPGVKPVFQSTALRLLEWIDLEYGGDRFATWVDRMLDDPFYRDLDLLGPVSHSQLSGLPTAPEILARGRPGDIASIGSLPTAALAAAYRAAPDPILASYLEERGHPLVVDPARVALQALITPRDGYFRRAMRHEINTSPGQVTTEQILELAHRYQLRPRAVARALARSGAAATAVSYLESELHRSGDVDLLYTVAELDTPVAWEALDQASTSPEHRIRTVSLEAAARTSSPLLPSRAVALLDAVEPGTGGQAEAESLTALLALEIQPTRLAADALLDVWRRRSHLGALRALARRRDHRVLDDCLLLLSDAEPAIAQVGAETLRDLRHPGAKAAVLGTLEVTRVEGLAVVLAHTLAMLQAIDAVPVLLHRAEHTSNQTLAELFRRWAQQLTAKASAN